MTRAWLPFLVVPAAWFVQGLVLWLVPAWNCPAASPVRAVALGVTAVAAAVAVVALWTGTRFWRTGDRDLSVGFEGANERDFGASVALLVSVFFALGIAANAVPAFFLSACEAMR